MRHLIYSEMMNGLIIERCTRDQEYNMIKHWHPEVEFQFFIRGKRKFFVDNENYVCSEGSLIVIDSEQVHTIRISINSSTSASCSPLKKTSLNRFFRPWA